MNELERLRDIDDKVFAEYQNYFEKISKSKFAMLYPNTILTIQLLDMGAHFLKNSIFDGCETDNYFGVKVQYRCMIEHYLKFQIIFIKWCKEKTDQFASEYIAYSNARDVLDSLRAQVSEQQLFDPNFKLKDWDTFLATHPTFKGKTRKEVDAESQKFTFKNMIRLLNDTYKSSTDGITPILGKFITDYSKLSSFVHGGTAAYYEMIAIESEEERQQEYDRLRGIALQQSCSIKLFSLLMLSQKDPVFGNHYHVVNELLKKVVSTDSTKD